MKNKEKINRENIVDGITWSVFCLLCASPTIAGAVMSWRDQNFFMFALWVYFTLAMLIPIYFIVKTAISDHKRQREN